MNARTRDAADQPVPYAITPMGQVFFLVADAYRRAKLLEKLCFALGKSKETIDAWIARHDLPIGPSGLRLLDEKLDEQLACALAADEARKVSRRGAKAQGARR